MKRFLPIFLISIFFASMALAFFVQSASAQVEIGTTPVPTGKWVVDQEVTFVGKTAARSNDFLQWTLLNYNWISITSSDEGNPLVPFWVLVRNIVFALLALFVLGAAFVMIITRGQNITLVRLVPKFLLIVVLIFLSFALVRFLYQAVDVIQGFFLTVDDPANPGATRLINPTDLLYLAFGYEGFTGYRQVGINFDESAFISLLLVKLTSITYYVMTGLLLIRKIILWFFIIVSPIFPLLLFFAPVRNTAKIWVGEFFRWLLYAPLFALFLHGLVIMWRDRIPLLFDFDSVGQVAGTDIVYPTAISILLGGPGQPISVSNSVNLPDTFALFVVALLMLWVVILLPFLLLQIFLDYIGNISITENPIYQRLARQNIPFFPKPPGGIGTPPSTPPSTPPLLSSPAGLAKSLPFFRKRAMQIPTTKSHGAKTQERVSSFASANQRETTSIMQLANLSVPKMRDVARFETAMLSRDVGKSQEVSRMHETLERIAKPSIVVAPAEREQFNKIREKLVKQQQKGDPLASSILSATRVTSGGISPNQKDRDERDEKLVSTLITIAHPERALNPVEREKAKKLKQKLNQEKQSDPLAVYVLDISEKISRSGISEEEKKNLLDTIIERLTQEKDKEITKEILPTLKASKAQLPTVNKVQQVSIEEYEEVKKMWQESYKTLDAPKDISGRVINKKEWLQNDINKIRESIDLLSSTDQQRVNQGMDMVANILPFLLIGGFSKNEVVSYLKAKLEAAKSVSEDMKREDVETQVEVGTKKEEEKQRVMKREIPDEKKKGEGEKSPLQ